MQTLGLAVASLARVVTRVPRFSLGAQPVVVALAAASVVGIGAGALTYYLRRSRSQDRDAVVLAWAWILAAGFVALIAYAMSGTAITFIVGIIALAVMHAFSPNRFQASQLNT